MAQTDRIAGYVGDIALKLPCRVATTGAITLSGLQTIDGVAVAAGDRVLVKNQVSAVENGIYFAATGSWPRTPDFDGARDAVKGTTVSVTDGTTLSGYWFEVSSENTNQPGVDALTFAETASGPASANSAANSAAAALVSEGAAAGSETNAANSAAAALVSEGAAAGSAAAAADTAASVAATGLTAGKAQQVDQAVSATVRAATTDLTGESLEGTLSDTGVAITAFHGVAGITYKRKCLGAGDITAGAGLTILQGGATITTAAGDTFEVYMLTATTCEVRNYVRAVAPSGRVLQTITTQSSVLAETTNTAMQDSGLGLSITPKYASSKLLVAFSIAITIPAGSDPFFTSIAIMEGATTLYADPRALASVSGVFVHGRFSGEMLIDATSTESRRYFVAFAVGVSGHSFQINHANLRTSSITIQELAQ